VKAIAVRQLAIYNERSLNELSYLKERKGDRLPSSFRYPAKSQEYAIAFSLHDAIAQ
jgi:hypothetical protein